MVAPQCLKAGNANGTVERAFVPPVATPDDGALQGVGRRFHSSHSSSRLARVERAPAATGSGFDAFFARAGLTDVIFGHPVCTPSLSRGHSTIPRASMPCHSSGATLKRPDMLNPSAVMTS